MQHNEVMTLLEQSKDLPKVPENISYILKILNNPIGLDIEDLSEKLSDCCELEKYILSLINCGYFQLMRKITSIKEAINYLGMSTVKILTVVYITRLLLGDGTRKAELFDYRIYWNHILGTAVASEDIYKRKSPGDKYRIFAYGLLHDIGIAVMDICIPDVIDDIFKMEKEKGLHQIIAERQIMGGITHSDIGAWICKRWGLPEDIQTVVEFHHRPFSAEKYIEEVMSIHVGDLISTNYYEKLLGLNFTNIYPKGTLNSVGMSENDILSLSETLHEKVESAKEKFSFLIL